MNKKQIANYAIAVILIILTAITSINAQQDKKQTFPVSNGDVLDVSSSFGNITYNSGSKAEVTITAKNILSDELDMLKMEKTGNRINVEFRGEDSEDFSFVITGPASLSLDFSTGGGNVYLNVAMEEDVDISTGGGNITTKDIIGKADLSTGGGNITINNVSGSADVSTGGGEIEVGNIDGKADLSTGGGNIKVASINNSADLSTGGGNITVTDVGGNADISTGGGNVKVGNVSGTVDVSTGGGNIELKSGSGKIETNTGAGNIKLYNITGYVDANTGAGNIYAELTPDGIKKSEFNTGMGDITLKVPVTAKAKITATVHVINWDDNVDGIQQIHSDFKPKSVNRLKGKKQIEAVFELNGGGSDIEINTGLGDIYIEELK